jgi:hypothetical protein
MALGEVASCSLIRNREEHTFQVRTTAANDRIQTQFDYHSADNVAQAFMTGPEGTEPCFLWSGAGSCEAPIPGLYTIRVSLYYEFDSDGSYVLGVGSWSNPESCTALAPDFFSLDSTGRDGAVPEGSTGECYSFAGAPGQMIRARIGGFGWLKGTFVNAAGEQFCAMDGQHECTLEGAGPYRLFVYEGYGNAATYRLRLTRLSDPDGCAPLDIAEFGTPSAAELATGKVGPDGLVCRSIVAGAGKHLVQMDRSNTASYVVRGRDGAAVCTEYDPGDWCDLPAAGTYYLFISDDDGWSEVSYSAAVITLVGNAGCAAPIDTDWTRPAVKFELHDMGVICQPFLAEPGERVEATAEYGYGWITDSTGGRICAGQEGPGCVLPGAGPYRFLAWFDAYGDVGVEVQVRSLSAPIGCPVVEPGVFGATPPAIGTVRCRSLTVPAAGRYYLRAVRSENYETYPKVYDPTGVVVCERNVWCDFAAAGKYTLVAESSSYTTVFVPASAPGCVPAGDQGAAQGDGYEGEFAAVGEVDCLQLPTPAGTRLAVLTPENATGASYPDLAIVDATGEYVCGPDWVGGNGCDLQGTAPFRAIISAREEYTTGRYRVAFQRTDRVTGCGDFPQGELGSNAGASVSFTGGRYVTCLAVPADRHATQEILSFARTAGAGKARLVLYGADGKVVCVGGAGTSRFMSCDLAPGQAYTAIMTADAVDGTYRVNRRNSTPAGAKCTAITSTTVGGRPSTGSIAARDDIHCYRISGAAATDAFWVGVRSNARDARYWATDSAGKSLDCLNYAYPCRLAGSASYQVFVWGEPASGAAGYELDTWRIASSSGLPAECPVETNTTAYGFGPMTGVLDGDKTGACLQIPARAGDDFVLDITNTEDGEATPEPFMISGGRIETCSYTTGGRGCGVSYDERSGKALVVLWAGPRTGRYPYRAQATCQWPLCGGNKFTVTGVTPASGNSGTRATITITGTSLHEKDLVELTASGRPAITATVRNVSADRTTLTAEVDLAGAAAGDRDVLVTSFAGDTPEPAGTFQVTENKLTNTKPVTFSGVARVGTPVKASTGTWSSEPASYAYSWSADGVAIPGATQALFAVPASALGKRLAVTVTARKPGLVDGSATSAAVTVETGLAPLANLRPSVTGTPTVGSTVQALKGAWAPTPDSYSYQWRLNGVAITGATGTSLKLSAAMAGKDLAVVVTVKRAGHLDGQSTSAVVRVTA